MNDTMPSVKKKSFSEFMRSRTGKQCVVSIVFLAIPLLLLIVFTYYPLVDMFRYSFMKWDGISKINKKFIGLQNYIDFFKNSKYYSVLWVSFYYLIGSFVQIGLALVLAAVLNTKTKFANFFKGTIFFPYLINGVAVGFIFLYFYQRGGTLDTLLTAIGFSQESLPYWLKDVAINNIALTVVSVWRYLGNNMVMFSGAMQSINGDLYEAASLDGANAWQQFIYIIVPNIRTIISINMIMAVKGAISVYEIPYIMTSGGNGTATFVTKTLEVAFTSKKIGMASAMGIILFIIVMIVTVIQKRYEKGAE